ncbi:MAG: AAA family ATPase [Eubacterium sp.]|nr:AAA family ATPase [Eubacterium sp.]
MEKCNLFLLGDREYTFYDYFSNIEMCFKNLSNIKNDMSILEQPMIMLAIASAIVGGKPIPSYKKYAEMIKFTKYFKDFSWMECLPEILDGSYVSTGLKLLQNKPMTKEDFKIYEMLVNHYFMKDIKNLDLDKRNSLMKEYYIEKYSIKTYFKEEEKSEKENPENKKSEKENPGNKNTENKNPENKNTGNRNPENTGNRNSQRRNFEKGNKGKRKSGKKSGQIDRSNIQQDKNSQNKNNQANNNQNKNNQNKNNQNITEKSGPKEHKPDLKEMDLEEMELKGWGFGDSDFEELDIDESILDDEAWDKSRRSRNMNKLDTNKSQDKNGVKDLGQDLTQKDREEILSSPSKLSTYLKKFVVGQDEAVDVFANVAFQYKKYEDANKRPPKHYNVLIIGASGSGKTTLMNAFDTLSYVHMVDCTGVTESGFKGKEAKDLITDSKYGNTVFYDEFDKILTPSFDSAGKDTHKEVQSCFYKMMEEQYAFNIFAGAFEGINEIVEKRLKSKHSHFGFTTDEVDSIGEIGALDVTEEDLIEYGATREFTGRIDVIIKMKSLKEEDFIRILRDSEYSPIKSEIAVAKDCYGIELELADSFYNELAAKASSQEIGARALKQHINKAIDPLLANGMEMRCDKIRVYSLEGKVDYILTSKEK